MKKSFFFRLAALLALFLVGCQVALPHQRNDEIAIDIQGDGEGLLRAQIINHLAFAGYRISDHSRFRLNIEQIETHDRDLGFRLNHNSKNSAIKASEADLVHSARAVLIDTFDASEIIGQQTIRAWTCFDFGSDRLNQEQLSYSRGALTIRSEARPFALKELRDQLAGKIATWAEFILFKDRSSASKTALSEGGAEQIIFSDID